MIFSIDLEKDFTFKLGAHQWRVEYTDVTPDMVNDHTTWGICVPEKQLIRINKIATPSMRLSTLLHEIMHAFEAVYEITIDHRDLNLVGDAFAQIMLDSFRDEPKKRKKR